MSPAIVCLTIKVLFSHVLIIFCIRYNDFFLSYILPFVILPLTLIHGKSWKFNSCEWMFIIQAFETKDNHSFWNNWATLYNIVVGVLADTDIAVASGVPPLVCLTSFSFSHLIHYDVPQKVKSLQSQRPRIVPTFFSTTLNKILFSPLKFSWE